MARPVESGSWLDHGSNRDVDAAAEVLTTIRTRARMGILVKADAANAGIVYVGNADLTAGTADATDGYPLSAGDAVLIEVEDARQLYVFASQVDQVVYWLAV